MIETMGSSRRRFAILVGMTALALAANLVFALLIQLAPTAPFTNWIDTWGLSVLAAGTAVPAAMAGRANRGRRRWAWWLIALAGIAWAVGNTLYIVQANAQSPSLNDLFYLGAVPLAALGLVMIGSQRATRGGVVRLVLDGLTVIPATVFISWALVLKTLWQADTNPASGYSVAETVTYLAYPVTDIVLVAFALLVFARQTRRSRLSIGLIAAGYLGLAIGDSGFNYYSSVGTYVGDTVFWSELGYSVGFSLIGLGLLDAWLHSSRRTATDSAASVAHDLGLLCYLPVAGAAVIAIRQEVIHASGDGVLFCSGLIVLVLVLIRQMLALRENGSLSRTLERRVAEVLQERRNLQRSEESFRSLFDENPQPMFVSKPGTGPFGDEDWRFLSVNLSALELYGYTHEEFLSLGPRDLRAGVDDGRLAADLRSVVDGRARFDGVQHRTKSGEVLDVELEVRETRFEGKSAKLVCTRNVTETMRLQRELEHQAFHDGLTGLPNRSLFHDRLEHAHQRLQRNTGLYAVLMVDLDNFKTVNDSLGHGAGDALLVEVAKRLTHTMRPSDTTARLGGDEFAILLEDLPDAAMAAVAANRVRDALVAPFSVGGRALSVTATVGIATSTGVESPSDVVRNADVALYVGKAGGRDRHDVFSEDMHASASERLTLEQDLRDGIDRAELFLEYQPKVDAQSGQLRGVEALVRWNHPARGRLSPDAFIPLAEQCGLITDVDNWVLREACRQARVWSMSDNGRIPVAVNVSGKNLVAARLMTCVQRALAESSLDPRLLELEITESAAIPRDAETLRLLQEIRDLGVKIAVDDFGTGYSVFSRLQGFQMDTLKIDLSFVRAIRAGEDAPIVDAMISMGRSLGLLVVAEGVETEVQREYLTRKGCAQLQGYLISRPASAADLAAWAKRTDFGLSVRQESLPRAS
jgi:diguanylate cyclase (GGDEF)-like protein/PAS domain S-box-containing protein